MIKDKGILIKNVYYMLSYAFQTINNKVYEDMEIESFDEMYNLLAAMLSKGVGIQLKQGLYKEYIPRQEQISCMRGKINIPATIKNVLSEKRVLTCDFDDLSEDNYMNQILKTTIFVVLKSENVGAEYKDALKKRIPYLSNVSLLDPKKIHWSAIRFQRNNQSYRMLIGVCQLIIEGMLTTTESGAYRLAKFVDEQHMHSLYQNFILEYYIRHYPSIKVKASQIKWALDDNYRSMLPIMQSDIHLQKDNTVLIIDAKYYSNTTQKRFDKHKVHSGNMYQIFTYVKNCDYHFGSEKHEVSGMLLYAKTEERIQPNNKYLMHGNRISVKTLDLNQVFADIAKQLDDILCDHFGPVEKRA